MDLVQLRYFLKVADLRSFTKAALALHIAQPAVTRQIRLLEEEFGVQLLLRHSRGAELTEAGVRLRAGAQAMLRLATETRAQVAASASEVMGELRVGFPPSVGASLVAKATATFHARHPAVRLHLEEGYSNGLRDALLADRLDLAVTTNATPNPLLDMQQIYTESLWAFYAPQLGSSLRGTELTLAQLARYPLIQLSSGNTLGTLLESLMRDQDLSLKVSVSSESLPVIKSLLQAGLGVHISPYTAFERDVRRRELAGKPMKGLTVARRVAWRVDRPRTLAQTTFLAVLQDEAKALVAQARGMIQL